MKFEAVQIYFLSDVFGLLSSKNFLPWQCDVTTSPLYWQQNSAYNLYTVTSLGKHRNTVVKALIILLAVFHVKQFRNLKSCSHGNGFSRLTTPRTQPCPTVEKILGAYMYLW